MESICGYNTADLSYILDFSSLDQCNNDYAPVCGSNNKFYNNECLLRRDACKQQTEILVVSEGPCPIGKFFFVLFCLFVVLCVCVRACVNHIAPTETVSDQQSRWDETWGTLKRRIVINLWLLWAVIYGS